MPTPLTPSSSGEIICLPPPSQQHRRGPRISAVAVGKRKREGSPLRAPLYNKTNAQDASGGRGASPSYTNKGKGRACDVEEIIIVDDDVDDDEDAGSARDGRDGFRPSKRPTETALDCKPEMKWDPSSATTLPRPRGFSPSIELKDQAYRARNAYDAKEAIQTGKRKIRREDVRRATEEALGRGREAVTAKMMSTLGRDSNPITNSDLYTRTDHFVSVATGHQVSNRGGGSSGAATYWTVRTAKMEEQAREKKSDLLKGCVFYINGSTGPRVSNLQTQHLITSHGGRFVPMQSSSCTHILAQNLSGSKTQKWIDGQAGRGGAKRTKIVRIDWLLDSVEKGIRLSEVPYAVIHNPHSILSAFAPAPKESDQAS